MKLSRKVFGLYPTNLPAVCRKFSIDLQHHDALSDTLACAKIMIEILKKTGS
jgi:DNA polymerase-3 subunit epsilon